MICLQSFAHLIASATLVWALTACTEQSTPTHTASSSDCKADSGRFALIVDGDTTVIDEYTRNDTLLRGVVQPQRGGFGWARYEVRYGNDGHPTGAKLEIGRRGTEVTGTAGRTWWITIDSGYVTEVQDTQAPRRVALSGRIVPVFGPSIAMLQGLLREAPPPTSPQQADTIWVFPLGRGAEPHLITLRRSAADAVMLQQPNRESYARGPPYIVDSCGRLLLQAVTPDGRFRTVRTR